jgi:hypothetical protein
MRIVTGEGIISADPALIALLCPFLSNIEEIGTHRTIARV